MHSLARKREKHIKAWVNLLAQDGNNIKSKKKYNDTRPSTMCSLS